MHKTRHKIDIKFRLLKTSLELQVNHKDHDMNNGCGQRVTLVIHTIIQVITCLKLVVPTYRIELLSYYVIGIPYI